MTHYLLTETPPSQRYDSAHCRTRQVLRPITSDNLTKSDMTFFIYFSSSVLMVTIEQTYGVLNKRFNALHTRLRTNPERACRIITTCHTTQDRSGFLHHWGPWSGFSRLLGLRCGSISEIHISREMYWNVASNQSCKTKM